MINSLSTTRHNVLLVTVDSLRADYLGMYSPEIQREDISPNIDQWAKGGLIFSRAITQSSHTSPAFLAILSGNYASKYGDWFNRPVSNKRMLLSEIFKSNGYNTCGINSNPYISHLYHFDKGFDLFIDNIHLHSEKTVNRKLLGVMAKIKAVIKQPYENAEHINNQVISMLPKLSSPYFIWVHYMDVHGPYLSRKGWGLRNRITAAYLWKKALQSPQSITDRERQRLIDSYKEGIHYLDRHIKELIANIDQANTIVILTADHGDLLGEHNVFGHSSTLYEGVLHVPLIIKLPSKLQYGGKKITQPVRSVDLTPTLTDLLGLKTEASFYGQSFASLIQENSCPYYCEVIISELSRKFLSAEKDGWKLIVNYKTNNKELYNIENDVSETNNIYLDNLSLANKLEAFIADHVRKNKSNEETPAIEHSKEIKERLKALGYMD